MKHIRVRFKEDDEDRGDLVVDLPLNADNVIAHEIPFAGWWGVPKGNNWIRPVVFKPNGEVEFGGDPEDDGRLSDMKLHGTVLEKGLRVFMVDRDDGEEIVFTLVSLYDLNDLSEIS